jgi:hypothetical protein
MKNWGFKPLYSNQKNAASWPSSVQKKAILARLVWPPKGFLTKFFHHDE